MAQVYQFVDDNGVTRLFAEIVPDPAGTPFNGGTITQELIIDTAATNDQALALSGTRTSEHDIFRIDYPHTVVVIDSDGVVSFTSDDHLGFQAIGTGGTHAVISATNSPGGEQATIGSAVGFEHYDGTRYTEKLNAEQFSFYQVAAPADGLLAPGDCALWFDQTDGAAKLMVKAKTANGTVATAAIALA
jgi:hypothetical protein